MSLLLQEFSNSCVHLSLGLTVLIGLSASEFSGAITIVALPITAISVTLSALCGSSLNSAYKNRRKLCDTLEFFRIWIEILEILAAAATCARIISATVDYITNEKFREWFLGIQSHSLGEPWPDVLGVSVIVVISGLFMMGLEKPTSFSLLLFITTLAAFIFFLTIGGSHSVISISKWYEDAKASSVHLVLSAAALCSYGFVNTFPKMHKFKALKAATIVLIPLSFYLSATMVFTLMSHYKELVGTAAPLLRVFEIRDVDWARLVMAIFIVSIVCLALTEIFPRLYGLFVILASKEWQIFLTSLQYKLSFTGAPILAIFAAGSLAAILAFACPLAYLIKILNSAALLKCLMVAFQVLYDGYKPTCGHDSGLASVSVSSQKYSKLKQSKRIPGNPNLKNKVAEYFSDWKKNISPSISVKTNRKKRTSNKKPSTSQTDNEYLLLNDYCEKSNCTVLEGDSSDESEEKESVLSSDVEEDSNSSTDIDAAVQEYKDKIQVATIDNFNESKFYPTHVTATAVAISLIVIVISSICLFQIITWRRYNLLWPCFTASFFSTLVVLVMPNSSSSNEEPPYQLVPTSLVASCAVLSVQLNVILVSSIIKEVWPGFIFWFCAGGLLLWRCDCCTCEGLINNQKNKLNITNNVAQYPENSVETILTSR